MTQTILITGGSGLIGEALCRRLGPRYRVVSLDRTPCRVSQVQGEVADLLDAAGMQSLVDTHAPDVVIHCAGIAHQKVGQIDRETYMTVNSGATEQLAKRVAEKNPRVQFLFLSSVSVYGELFTRNAIPEDHPCRPSSDYAESKLDAERRLLALHDSGELKHLQILRLAPVYDRDWHLNLARRILAPKGLSYLRFGAGEQKMSALAKDNLTAFIAFCLSFPGDGVPGIYNVCDASPYAFNEMIRGFRQSGKYPWRPTLPVPLGAVKMLTRLAGAVFPRQKNWWHACHDKLAYDLVYDNQAMLATGFTPEHSLDTLLSGSSHWSKVSIS